MSSFNHPFLNKLQINNSLLALVRDGEKYLYKDLLDRAKYILENVLNTIDGNTKNAIAIVDNFSDELNLDSIAMILAGIEKSLIIAPINDDSELEYKLKSGEINFIFQNCKIKKINEIKNKNSLFNKLEKNSGLIIFSSGSTGNPKAILHNLDLLLSKYINKKNKKINVLASLLFDHIGGLNTMFSTFCMGGSLIIPKSRKDPYEIARLIEEFNINLLPTSPTLLNLLLISGAYQRYNLDSLKLITYGTESMSESLLNRLKKTFPKVRFKQSFGTSEIGIASSNGDLLINITDMDFKIINNELFIKSPTQSIGYLNASNEVFKDGYFPTGDIVNVISKNNKEYLHIVGRKKDLINIGGEKVLPQEIENTLLEMPSIKDCLVYGESNPITGESISVKIVSDLNLNNMELKKEIRKFCKDKLAPYKIPTKVVIVDSINATNRGKKQRNGGGAARN